MLIIIFGSLSFGFYNSYEKNNEKTIINKKLSYRRKNLFSNNIKKISSILALQTESSITSNDVYYYFLKKNIFDLVGYEKLADNLNKLDLKTMRGKELSRMRNNEYRNKLKTLRTVKNIFKYLKNNPDLIKWINEEIIRNFYSLLISSSESSDFFVNFIENSILKSFSLDKSKKIMIKTKDSIKMLKFIFNLTKKMINEHELSKKFIIPKKIKDKKGKQICRILEFLKFINNHFKKNKTEFNVKLWEVTDSIIYDYSKYSLERKLEYKEIYVQLEKEGSFVNRNKEFVLNLLKEKLFKNAAKLFVHFSEPLMKKLNLNELKNKILDISDSRLQSFMYLIKIFTFSVTGGDFFDSNKKNLNFKEIFNFFSNILEKIDFDSFEIGVFKKELLDLFEKNREKYNFIFSLILSDSSNFLDKILKKFIINFNVFVEDKIGFFSSFLDKVEIPISEIMKIFEIFKDKEKLDYFFNKLKVINEKIDEILKIVKNNKLNYKQKIKYVELTKEFNNEIIEFLISAVKNIFNKIEVKNESFGWFLKITNIFLQQLKIVSENLGHNVLTPSFDAIVSLNENKDFLIDILNFVKFFGNEVITERFLKISLLYKDKLNWTNRKRSYCYIKSLIRNEFNPEKDCKLDEIDVEKPDFTLLNKEQEFKVDSPIEKESPIAKIINFIHQDNFKKQEFKVLKKFIDKILINDPGFIDKLILFIENEYDKYYYIYLNKLNWKFDDIEKEWEIIEKKIKEGKDNYYNYSFVGTLKIHKKILYSYNFVYSINLKTFELKILEMNKLV